jgi:hypothetical protein
MSESLSHAVIVRRTWKDATPYFSVFGMWWLLAMLVTSIRIQLPAWHYVLELFWWQALLLAKVIGTRSEVVTRGAWLLAYALLALLCWGVLESRRGRPEAHVWRRAWISSAAVQAVLLLLAMATSAE